MRYIIEITKERCLVYIEYEDQRVTGESLGIIECSILINSIALGRKGSGIG